MAIKTMKPTTPARRYQTYSTFEEITATEPEKSLTKPVKKNGRPQQPRPSDEPSPRRRAQAQVPRRRLPPRQDGHPRQGEDHRVRPEPLGAHRAAELRRRREALHRGPRGPEGGRPGHHERLGRHQARQRDAAAQRPPGLAHPQHRAEPRQGRPDGPLRRHLRPAHGQGRRLRPGEASLRRGRGRFSSKCKATIGQVGNVDARGHQHRQGGPHPLAGQACPRCAAWP